MRPNLTFKPWDVITFCGDAFIVTRDFGDNSGYVREVCPSDQYPFYWRFEGEDVVIAPPHVAEDMILWDIQNWIVIDWAQSNENQTASSLVNNGKLSEARSLYIESGLPGDVDVLISKIAEYCPLVKPTHGVVTTFDEIKIKHCWVEINGKAYDFAKSALLMKVGKNNITNACDPRVSIESKIKYKEVKDEV